MSKSAARGSPSLQELLPRSKKRPRQDKTASQSRKRRKSISHSESDSELDQFSDALDGSRVIDDTKAKESEEKYGDDEIAREKEIQKLALRSTKQDKREQSEKIRTDAEDRKTPVKSTHVRFGSEDAPEITLEEETQTAIPERDDSDDDEAPEAVATSTAQEKAQEIASGAARAIKGELKERMRKQSERDAQLKRQSEASAQKQKTKQANKAKISARETLPDLLPAEILNSAPFERPPTPELVNRESLKAVADSKHKVRLDVETPTLKDRKVGKLKVRVLEELNGALAPRPNPKSKAIREAMLTGRGSKRGPTYERKKVNRGFLTG